MSVPFVWDENFPIGYGHTSIAFLKRCPEFEAAKNGDLAAARFVVRKCIKQDRITKLRKQYPCAVLLPILCKNKLPLSLARIIGLPIWYNVNLFHIISRKTLNAIQRLLHKPIFVGYVKKDVDYIIVDDIITQGGTIAALRKFVISQGGRVVAVVALAYAIGGHIIAPTKKNILQLLVKFGRNLILCLRMFGIAARIQELTNSQVKYLLRFASIENIHKKLLQIDYSTRYAIPLNLTV